MRNVIITDSRYRMTVASIRGLAEAGMNVTVVEYDDTSKYARLGHYSRYATAKKEVPNAIKKPVQFIDSIIGIAQRMSSKPYYIPVGIDSLMVSIKYEHKLSEYVKLLVPTKEAIDITNDTARLLEQANMVNVPCPFTTTLQDDEDVKHLAHRIKYPVVIKYREGELLKLKPNQRYKIINNEDDFIKIFNYMHSKQSYPLVQEYVKGDGYGVAIVMDKNSNPCEIFSHKRLREYPATGGPSCLCESYWDDEMVDYAVRLLKQLGWVGIAMVEFKGDKLMEINPRFWGSMPLSIIAGSNIPYAICEAMDDGHSYFKDNSFTPHYRLGTKMRYIMQDIMCCKDYLKITQDKKKFMAGYIKDIFDFNIKEGLFTLRDPKPFFMYFVSKFIK